MCSLVVGIQANDKRYTQAHPWCHTIVLGERLARASVRRSRGLSNVRTCFAAHMTDVVTKFFREHSVLEAGSLTMSSQLIDLVVTYTSFVLQVGILSCRSFAHVSQPQCFVDVLQSRHPQYHLEDLRHGGRQYPLAARSVVSRTSMENAWGSSGSSLTCVSDEDFALSTSAARALH